MSLTVSFIVYLTGVIATFLFIKYFVNKEIHYMNITLKEGIFFSIFSFLGFAGTVLGVCFLYLDKNHIYDKLNDWFTNKE